MVKIEIDVSGDDLLNRDYTICIADGKFIKGFKFSNKIVNILSSKYGQGFYRYKKSNKQKALFKIRLYSIVIYYLLKSLNIKEKISLVICRDFQGREEEIKNNLKYFLIKKLGLICEFEFTKLGKESVAHQYAYLMRKDKRNKLTTYVDISLDNLEEWLK